MIINDETAPLPHLPRTITSEAWSEACRGKPAESEDLPEIVNRVMAELVLDTRSRGPFVGYKPWPSPREHCSGAMWASVPRLLGHWRESNDGYILSRTDIDEGGWSKDYLRLAPAQESLPDVVQYGFCPLRVNRLEERTQKEWAGGELRIQSMRILTNHTSPLRADKMVHAALSLFLSAKSNPNTVLFKKLLGRQTFQAFIKRLLRGCYEDRFIKQDVLHNKPETYVQLVSLVAKRAYRNLLLPRTELEFRRFRAIMGLENDYSWSYDVVYPRIHTVIMPRPIFEANITNLQVGIPPIIPHYVTPNSWMFNGSAHSPCTGLDIERLETSPFSRKLIAGVGCISNTDLPGRVSCWNPEDNPPQEWVDSFVQCIERLKQVSLPQDLDERHDRVLYEARRVPIMFIVPHGKFVRVTDLEIGSDYSVLKTIALRRCNASGDEWIGRSTQHNFTGEEDR